MILLISSYSDCDTPQNDRHAHVSRHMNGSLHLTMWDREPRHCSTSSALSVGAARPKIDGVRTYGAAELFILFATLTRELTPSIIHSTWILGIKTKYPRAVPSPLYIETIRKAMALRGSVMLRGMALPPFYALDVIQ